MKPIIKDINGGRGVEMKINETREKAIKMKEEGESYGKIYKELNISKNTIKSWARRANISSYNGNKPKSKKLKKEISARRGYEKRIKKLEMELELLRDFIYETERRNVRR